MTKFQRYHCPACGQDANIEVFSYGHGLYSPVASAFTQLTCSILEDGSPDNWTHPSGEVKNRMTVRVLCPACQSDTFRETGHRINGTVGKTACEAICEKATSAVCRCQCGGLNHGIRS